MPTVNLLILADTASISTAAKTKNYGIIPETSLSHITIILKSSFPFAKCE